MSDVSKTNDLIAEKLREAAKRADWYQTGEAKLLDAAADALEAATSGPSGDGEYLLSVIETIKQTGGSVEIHGVKIMPCDEFGRTAAVPDAATAAVERVRAAKCEVDSVHHIHGADCLCGFSSARSRSRTEHITEAMLASLGGAPEPEWEYGVWNERWAMYPHQERPYPSLAEAQHEASRYPSRRHVVRRRKAGPWSPMEPEVKP